MVTQLDPVTGVPSDLLSLDTTQVPLNSDPVLAPEWKPQGRYGQIYHPDNIPTVFGTLQAYNNGQPDTVQALSTDGKKNLNVNIASSGTVENANASMLPNCYVSNEYGVSSGGYIQDGLPFPVDILYQLTWSFQVNGAAVPDPGPSSRFTAGIGGATRWARLHAISLPLALSPTDRFANQSGTIIYPGGMDLRTLGNTQDRTTLYGVVSLQPMIVFLTLLYWSASGGTS